MAALAGGLRELKEDLMGTIVKQAEGKPEVPAEVIAQSIVKISKAADDLMRSGLTLKAILILLSAASGENRKVCQNVLWAMQNLRQEYLTPHRK